MAQTRIFEFDADDSTYALNTRQIAQVPPGRYRGFDYDASSSGLNLVLSHSTGVVIVKEDQTYTPPTGIIKAHQGVEIREDDDIEIAVVGNSGNANPRVDLVVVEHEYVTVTGGQDATYVVLQGTPSANPSEPPLTSLTKQIVIGKIYWPANAGNITAATYTKVDSPHFNGEVYRYTNTFMENATYNSGTTTVSAALASNLYYLVNSSANYVDVSRFDVPLDRLGAQSNEVGYIHIYTRQALRLISGGNIELAVGSFVHIPAGSTFSMVNLKGTSLGAGASKYLFVRGSEQQADTPHKSFAQSIANQGLATINTGAGTITPDLKGNSYELTYAVNNQSLNRMLSTDSFADPAVASTKGGGVIYLRIIDTGASTTAVGTIVNGLAVSGNMKGFDTRVGANIPVYHGDTIMLLETPTAYIVLGQVGLVVNPIKLHRDYHAYLQTEEKRFTKTIHTGYAYLPTPFDVPTQTLILTPDGNSFQVLVPSASLGGVMNHIRLQRPGEPLSDFPDGSIINIRFSQNYTPGVTEPFVFNLDPSRSSIISAISDFSKSAGGSPSVLHTDPANPDADIYWFRRDTGKWTIVAMAPPVDAYNKIKDLYTKLIPEPFRVVGDPGQPPYQNSHSGFAANRFRFRKDTAGSVRFMGAITLPGGWTSGSVVCQLPVGYRPPADEQWLAADNSGITPAVLYVGSDGNVRVYSTASIAGRSIYTAVVRFDV